MGVITILIPLFSRKGIKLSCTCNSCLQDQQSVFADLHTLNSPWWGVHVSESQCRGHSWLGGLLLGRTQEAIKVCDCFARLQSPRFVSWSIYKSNQLKLYILLYMYPTCCCCYLHLLMNSDYNEQFNCCVVFVSLWSGSLSDLNPLMNSQCLCMCLR